MKTHLLVAVLLMGATGSLMSMLELPDMKECKKLKFLLDHQNCITKYNIQTKNKVFVTNFGGQRFLAIKPFTNSALASYLQHNQVKDSKTLALELEDKQFLVEITPVMGFGVPSSLLIKMKALDNF